jgi:hypothetical protein
MIPFFDKIELYFSFIDNKSSLSPSLLPLYPEERIESAPNSFKKSQSLLRNYHPVWVVIRAAQCTVSMNWTVPCWWESDMQTGVFSELNGQDVHSRGRISRQHRHPSHCPVRTLLCVGRQYWNIIGCLLHSTQQWRSNYPDVEFSGSSPHG